MTPRKIIIAFLLLVPYVVSYGCDRAAREPECFEIAVVMDAGGLGDKGKNDMVWRGCQRFAEESRESAKISSCEPSTEAEGPCTVKELDALCRPSGAAVRRSCAGGGAPAQYS